MNITEVTNSSFNYSNTTKNIGRKLRLAGFKDYPPLLQFSTCPTWSMKNCLHPGADAEFLEMALKTAGLDYEVIQHVGLNKNFSILDIFRFLRNFCRIF